MLTSFQCEPVGYENEQHDTICADCAHILAEGKTANVDEMFIHYYGVADPEATGFYPGSRYGFEEAFPEGRDCDRCGRAIVEPDPDYCTEHGAWRMTSATPPYEPLPYCEEARPVRTALGEEDPCTFARADSNPPVPRWVPCQACGVGDGQRHRVGCPYITPAVGEEVA